MTVPAVPLRTFKHRRGRITTGQQRALDSLWGRYGVELTTRPINTPLIYARRAPLVLEIGFGMGEATVAMAAASPDDDVLAVDVHTPGAGALLREVNRMGLRNVRVVVGDAVLVLRDMIEPESLKELRVLFPDPWPKAKHRKRRLLTPRFARLAATRLRLGGRLCCATDCKPYAEQMLAVVAGEPLLRNECEGYAPRPADRPITRFERQALANGNQTYDVLATRVRRGEQ